jgi:hypothetical protein
LKNQLGDERIAIQGIDQLLCHIIRKIDGRHIERVDNRIIPAEQGDDPGKAIHRRVVKKSGLSIP